MCGYSLIVKRVIYGQTFYEYYVVIIAFLGMVRGLHSFRHLQGIIKRITQKYD